MKESRMAFHGWVWMLVSVLLMHQQPTMAKLDKSLYCAICRAVVEDINYRILKTDPNRKVKVSSFRMGVDGKRHTVEKPYARSNEHLSKVFGEVCESMKKDYGLRQLPGGKLTIVRIRTHTGEDLHVKNVGVTDNIQNVFKGYCQSLIEESEDDMWTLFKLEDLHAIESELCVKMAGMCTEEDLETPFSSQDEDQDSYDKSFQRPAEEAPEEVYAMEDEDDKVIRPESSDDNIIRPESSEDYEKSEL